jgi:glycosyltransferase involved in cell wall biosynthesis
LLFVESEINENDCEKWGLPYKRAFGINDNFFIQYIDLDKEWIAVHHGTCASWKRQQLLAEAMGEDALIFGREQENDSQPFDKAEELGAEVKRGHQPYEETAKLLNQCEVMVQTSNFWGGGQRATLEAMACGLPVVAMKDSPKNCEFVRESGNGKIVDPEPDQIREAVYELRDFDKDTTEYVKNNWTAEHYANSLKEGICQL